MNSPLRTIKGLLGLGFLLAVAQVFAAVPVEDRSSSSSSSSSRPQLRPTPVVVEPGGSDFETPRSQAPAVAEPAPSGLAQLFSELQTLRSEVQELRSTVEEQNHKIRQLEASQQEQYRDLDGRVAQMSSGAGRPASAGTSRVDQPVVGNNGTPSTTAGGAGTAGTTGTGAAGEKGAYAAAFDSMKTRQFDKSIEQFSRLIQDYPNGEMTPGSYYWLGELYLAKANMELSRQSFAQVIDLYPTHNKAPDALYKLGVVYHRQGDSQKALEFLDRVQREFPTSAAAGLAKTYASELR